MRCSESAIEIVIDTREQRPLDLPGARRGTLTVGDYSVAGYENTIIGVERKSLPDLYACIAQERDRFEKCLKRLSQLPYPALVLECTMADILAGARFSQVHPQSAFGSLIAWGTKYRIPIWLAGNRRAAAMTVQKILDKAVKYSNGASNNADGRL